MVVSITKYKVVSQMTPEALSNWVDIHIGEGWQPYGSPFSTKDDIDEDCYHQAVVRYG